MKKSNILLISLISFVFMISLASADVVYPLYSSTCCQLGTAGYTPLKTDTFSQATKTFTCPVNSACQVVNPSVDCSSLGNGGILNLWLGYTPIWQIQGNGGTYSSTSQSDKNTLALGLPFSEGQSITYSGACAGNAKWVVRVLTYGISMFFEGATAPPSSSLNINARIGQLVQYPALEGQYTISGTQYCQRNAQVETFKNNLPTNDALGKASAEIGASGASNPNSPDTITATLLDTTRFYLDTCRRGVDKYISLPNYGNVNPKGQYQGQDVICSMSKGIVSVVNLQTNGGATELVPSKILNSNPGCCSDQDCSSLGSGYACQQNTYTCQKIAGYCNNDLDCDPNHGENEGMNCYKNGNSFYTLSSRCVSNRCSPYPAQTASVACCPGYCALNNQVCNPSTGCYTPQTPQPQCPSGSCCDGITNQQQGCTGGLTCCYDTNSAHVGVCKTTCSSQVECSKNSDCPSDKPICENNKCTAQNITTQCSWYQDSIPNNKEVYAWYDVFHMGTPKVVQEGVTCKFSTTITIALIVIAIFLIAGIVIAIAFMNRRRK